MKIIGLIAEYNPFHLGHIYQIKKIKELYPNSLIIVIISPSFTQRGEISLINKWDKAKICLDNDIDLVIELPTLFATQSADIFAYAAINILNSLKVDTLVFGTESDNINSLIKLANTQINDSHYNDLVKKYLDSGLNYPTAMSRALYDITNIKIDKPNDLLALSYIKEIIKGNYNIMPVSIKRTNDYHSKEINSSIINASLIRQLLHENKDIAKFVPEITTRYIYRNISLDSAYNYLKYSIVSNYNILGDFLSVDEGVEFRIKRKLIDSDSWDLFVKNIKTRRYTYNKINRMLIHILLNIKKKDNIRELYIRILGFNNRGRSYLNKIKKEIKIPVFTNYKPNKSSVFDLEYQTTFIYSLIVNDPALIKMEYQNKPIIKN